MTDILDRIAAQVKERPAAPAIVGKHGVITYSELGLISRRIAYAIYNTHVEPRVAILLPQIPESYAAMMGALLAGGYYCPINTSLPLLRKRQILDQFDPDVVILSRSEQLTVQALQAKPRCLFIDEIPNQMLEEVMDPHELAYVIFTSGSTGIPKGVMIRRKALNKFIDWSIEATEVGPADRWAQFSNLGFDLSVMDTYSALGSGALLVPFARPADRMLPAMAISRYQITIWHSVPSVIDLMNSAHHVTEGNLRSLRLMSFCGEPLRPQHLELLFSVNRSMKVFNTYGPTETTVFCTWEELDATNFGEACESSVAIGQTIPGWRIDLVGGADVNEGEIVISGDYLGAGYWQNSSATEAAYRTTTIDGINQSAYYTGDWADRKGQHLFFRHRIDRQVKVHGFRIELDELDFFIREYGIPNSRCILYRGKIYAFLESEEPLDVTDVQNYLSQRVPLYAVPSEFIVMPTLPRNHNEKVDVNALIVSLAQGADQ